MIICGTGHRPESTPYEFDCMVDIVEEEILKRGDIETVISGMAAGFDLALGYVAMKHNLELWCAKPWATHGPRKADTDLYDELEDYATRVYLIIGFTSYPGPWVYDKRNEWMVGAAHQVWAFWNGHEGGGTYKTVLYTQRVVKDWINLYPKDSDG